MAAAVVGIDEPGHGQPTSLFYNPISSSTDTHSGFHRKAHVLHAETNDSTSPYFPTPELHRLCGRTQMLTTSWSQSSFGRVGGDHNHHPWHPAQWAWPECWRGTVLLSPARSRNQPRARREGGGEGGECGKCMQTGDGWRAPKSPEVPRSAPTPPPMIWHLCGPAEATARHFAHPCPQRQHAGDELGGSLGGAG